MPSKVEQLMTDIRTTPIFRQLIPQEAGIGWPIPLRKANKVYVILPFYGYRPIQQRGETELFPPFSTITLDWSILLPMEYVDLRFRSPYPQEVDWGKPVGIFPHPGIAQLTVQEYKNQRSDLLSMYNEMLDMLTLQKTAPPSWEERFNGLLRLLMEPSLEPYYRALAPKFFNYFLRDTNTSA